MPPGRPAARRRQQSRWRGAQILALIWLVLAAAIWVVVGGRVSAGHGAELGAVVATAVMVGAHRAPPRRRR